MIYIAYTYTMGLSLYRAWAKNTVDKVFWGALSMFMLVVLLNYIDEAETS